MYTQQNSTAASYLESISQHVRKDTIEALEKDVRKLKRELTGTDTIGSSDTRAMPKAGTDSLRNAPPKGKVEEGEWTKKLQADLLDGGGKKGGNDKKSRPQAPPRVAAASLVDYNSIAVSESLDNASRPSSASGNLPAFARPVGKGRTRTVFPPLMGPKSDCTVSGVEAQAQNAIEVPDSSSNPHLQNETDYWTSLMIPPEARPVILREGRCPELAELFAEATSTDQMQDGLIYIPTGTVSALINSAEVCHNYGKYSQALRSYLDALQHWREQPKDEDDCAGKPTTGAEAYIRLCVASVYESQNKDEQALEQTLLGLNLLRELPETHPLTSATLMRLGCLCFYRGELKLAGRCFARALYARRELFGPRSPPTAVAAVNLASTMLIGGEHGEAATMLTYASQILSQELGYSHPFSETASRNLYKAKSYFSGTVSDQIGNSGRRPVETSTRADLHRLCLNGNYQVHVSAPLVDPFAKGGGKKKGKKKK
eukprot:gb/GECG01008180.1/.p1 GENE.gb/GECG01008180.1/~~gb/GECG01008180.1/.p1  ORF type:complete len:486 (+),score=60.50 gb/GECG01008180.1/:1-1458(+)